VTLHHDVICSLIHLHNPREAVINTLNSLVLGPYALLATILGADLCPDAPKDPLIHNQNSAPGGPTRAETIKALDLSAQLFSRMRDQSTEAYKLAADVLGKRLEGEGRNTL